MKHTEVESPYVYKLITITDEAGQITGLILKAIDEDEL